MNAFDQTVQAIQAWADATDAEITDLHRQVEDLRRTHDNFAAQFQYGRTFVQGLIYKRIYDATLTIPTGGPHQLPATPIETGHDLQHAYYRVSAFQTGTSGQSVLYDGTVAVFPANSVTVAIERLYQAGAPPRLETYLSWYNNKGSSVNVSVRVIRLVGVP